MMALPQQPIMRCVQLEAAPHGANLVAHVFIGQQVCTTARGWPYLAALDGALTTTLYGIKDDEVPWWRATIDPGAVT